mmetsp:Transcript_22037/g.67659  ORF Transcript_22037/g.67659 Transcript_22037/m.67659 type:complete len:224 (+) Transcript_22037:1388-2059(+)
MFSLLSCDTMTPGPDVAGPEMNAMMRAPRCGADVSMRPTATDSAAPVQRAWRLSDGTGHGSRARSDRIDSSVKLHSSTLTRYLPMAGTRPDWPPAAWPAACAPPPCGALAEPTMPSSCCTLDVAYSCVPRNTTERGQSAKLRSCTCTFVPKVMRPTSASCGSRLSDCCTLSLRLSSSSSTLAHVSMTSRKSGGPASPLCSSYSTVENRGTSSAGRFCSVMFSA